MRMSGGTSETEETAFAVSPYGLPLSSRVVMTVTPVAKWPITRRSSFLSIGTARSPRAGLLVAFSRVNVRSRERLGHGEADRERRERAGGRREERGFEAVPRRKEAERHRADEKPEIARHAVDADHRA